MAIAAPALAPLAPPRRQPRPQPQTVRPPRALPSPASHPPPSHPWWTDKRGPVTPATAGTISSCTTLAGWTYFLPSTSMPPNPRPHLQCARKPELGRRCPSTNELCPRQRRDRASCGPAVALEVSAKFAHGAAKRTVLDRSESPAPPASGLAVAEHLVDQLLAFGCLAQVVAERLMACGRPQDDALVIRRQSRDLRQYRLRGSFVPLLHGKGTA